MLCHGWSTDHTGSVSWMVHRPHRKCVMDGPQTTQEVCHGWSTDHTGSVSWMVHRPHRKCVMDGPQTTQEVCHGWSTDHTGSVSWMVHRPHRKCVVFWVIHRPHRKWSRPHTVCCGWSMSHRIDNTEVIQDSGVMGDIMTLELTQRLPDWRSEYMDLFKKIN